MTKKAVGNAGQVYKKYTEEFRRDAVRMIESEGLTTAEAGRRLGVNANLLRKWRPAYGKKSETQAAQSDLEAEKWRLRDEVRRELLTRGYEVCENTVAKLMNSEGITSSTAKRFRVSTTDSNHSLPVAENILDRDFTAEGPGQKVVSDLTYIATAEGFLYLVCMIDVFSRRVIGWSMSHEMTTDVFLSALEMAVGRLGVKDNLLLHSDRGSQYCSSAFQAALARHEIRCSMSRKGNCWDNAVSESFFASLKKELVYQQRYATRDEARQSIFQWIETFYNRTRLHSHLLHEP